MREATKVLSDVGCPEPTHTYLGDGVYAGIDHARQLWLVTERPDGVDTIALERATLDALEEYTFKHAGILAGIS